VPEAVIVSVARTPIGKAYRGALNNTHGPTLGAHAVAAAVERAGVEGSEVDDVIVGGSLLARAAPLGASTRRRHQGNAVDGLRVGLRHDCGYEPMLWSSSMKETH
jgi:acetyl-CoA acetyltransferase